jgi:hypothetical protein
MFGSIMYLMEGYLFFGEPLMHANAREWFDRLTNVVRQAHQIELIMAPVKKRRTVHRQSIDFSLLPKTVRRLMAPGILELSAL